MGDCNRTVCIRSACYYIFCKIPKMELRFSMLRPRVKYMKAIAALGMASCINQIAMAIVQITMNNTLRHYGEMSVYGTDIPLACVGIISKVNMVFMAICIGISQGCQPIWGFNYGAGSFGRVRKTFWRAFEISVLVGVVFLLYFRYFHISWWRYLVMEVQNISSSQSGISEFLCL